MKQRPPRHRKRSRRSSPHIRSKKKLTEKKPKALLDICYRAKGNGAPGKLVLKGVKHPK